MAISQRLDLRQTQSLVMTPQLQQAIKLLQLSNVELTEFVEDELSQNPMLERDDGEPGGREQGGAELTTHRRKAMKSLTGGIFDGYDGRGRSTVIGRQAARYGL